MEVRQWKPIVGYEGIYEISDMGDVKRLAHITIDSLGRRIAHKDRIIRPRISRRTGYPTISLYKDGRAKSFTIHSLIAKAFIPNPLNLPCVNHIDEDRSNSVLSNLEWCDYSYNNTYGKAREKRLNTYRLNSCGKHRPIYKFSLDGHLLDVFTCGVNQLERELGYHISDCLAGKCKTSHGFVFSYNRNFQYRGHAPKSHQKFVIKIDESGNEIERYESVSIAGRENGFDRHMLSRKKPIGGIIAVNGMRFIVEEKENEYIPKGHKGSRPDLKGKLAKPICQYSKDGLFIKEFSSIAEAAESLGSPRYSSEISNCCNGRLKTARGFIWRFKGSPQPTPFANNNKRKINQYSMNGDYIATYPSIKDAAVAVGSGKPNSIQNCLLSRSKSAFGYIWKYADAN